MNIAVFSSVATQLMTSDKVELDGEPLPIHRLKSVSFNIEGREQNPEKPKSLGRVTPWCSSQVRCGRRERRCERVRGHGEAQALRPVIKLENVVSSHYSRTGRRG
jgi:hypothetical protein